MEIACVTGSPEPISSAGVPRSAPRPADMKRVRFSSEYQKVARTPAFPDILI